MQLTQVQESAKQSLKSSFDRARNRLNTLEKIAGQMKDSTDTAIQAQHSTVVGIVADLRSELGPWQEQLNGN